MYTLFIGNKNYSSWSLRPWFVLTQLQIPFEEQLLVFGDAQAWQAHTRRAGAGLVPCLVDEGLLVWDSLAIVEYLAERHPGVWPTASRARAWSRSVCAEMHSGFETLRRVCTFSIGVRVQLHEQPPALERDLQRLQAIWQAGLDASGGPFLNGSRPTASDAFFAPVAFRVQTYGLSLEPVGQAYCQRLLDLPAMRQWEAAALAEPFRDEPHDRELDGLGVITEDLRAPAESKA